MTQNRTFGDQGAPRHERHAKRQTSPLSLREWVSADWHQDEPAYAGDPIMDWQSEPERPQEVDWRLTFNRRVERD